MNTYLLIIFLLVSGGAIGMEKQEVEGSIGVLIQMLSNNKQYYERECQRSLQKIDELTEFANKLCDPAFQVESLEEEHRGEFLMTLEMLEKSDYLKKYDEKLKLIEQEIGILKSCQNLIKNPSLSSRANQQKVKILLVGEFKRLKQLEDAIMLQ